MSNYRAVLTVTEQSDDTCSAHLYISTSLIDDAELRVSGKASRAACKTWGLAVVAALDTQNDTAGNQSLVFSAKDTSEGME
jgi:hypothetical protein